MNITERLRAKVKDCVCALIEEGARTFLFGGMSDFDDLVYDIVTDIRDAQPELGVRRTFCFPLDKNLHKPPRWFRRKQYEALECPMKSFDYWYTSLYYRNCAMIDKSDVVLFYVEPGKEGGARKALDYANKSHKRVINFSS